MDCVKLIFVLLLIVKLVFAAPYSPDEFKNECDDIRKELSVVSNDVREEFLIANHAKERLEKRELKEELKQELKEGAEELGVIKTEKKLAQRIQIRFIPRALVESIEEDFDIPYKNAMESIRKEISSLETEEKKISGQLTHVENQLKNSELDSNALQSLKRQKSNLIDRQTTVVQKIGHLKNKSPPLTVDKINNRATRIAKRKHMWLWILENGSENRGVQKILKYIKKWYDAKTEEYRTETSIDKYREDFCQAMAATHEEINVTIAHVLRSIPIKPGFEFKKIPIYKKENMDEFIAILINAIGFDQIKKVIINLSNDKYIFQKLYSIFQKTKFIPFTSFLLSPNRSRIHYASPIFKSGK